MRGPPSTRMPRDAPPMGAADCRLARGHYCAMGCPAAGCYAVMLGAWRAVCWLCCAVLSYGDALRWLCGAACCPWSGGYLSLFVVLSLLPAGCGAVWWRWCCRGAVLSVALLHWCWSTVCASSSARHALLVSVYCPAAFTGCRLSSCRIPSVAVPRSLVSAAPRSLCVSSDTYHYSSFHNYLMITVTYNLSDNGVYPMQ